MNIALGPDVGTMLVEPVGGKLEDIGTLLLTLVEKVLNAAIEIVLSVFVEASVGSVAVMVLLSLDEALDPLVSTILLVLVRGMLDTMIVTALFPLVDEVLDLVVDIRLLVLAGGTLDPVVRARLLVLAKNLPDPVIGTVLLMLVRVALGTISVENSMLLVEGMLGIAVDTEVLFSFGEPLVRMVIKVLLSPAKVEVVPTFESGFVALTEEKLGPPIVKVSLVLGEDTVPKLLAVEIPFGSMLETLNTIVDVTVIDSVVEAIALTSVMLELSLGEVLVLVVPDVEVMVTCSISDREKELEDPLGLELSLVKALGAFPPRVEVNVIDPMVEEVMLGLLIEPLAAMVEETVRGPLVDRTALTSLMETSVNPLVELLAILVEVVVTGPVKDNVKPDPLVEGPVVDAGPASIIGLLVSVLKVSIVETFIVTEAALEAFVEVPLVETPLNGLTRTSGDDKIVTGTLVEAAVLDPPVVGPAVNREVLDPLIVTLPCKIAEVTVVRGSLFTAVVPGPLVKVVSLACADRTSVPDVLDENVALDWLNRLPLLVAVTLRVEVTGIATVEDVLSLVVVVLLVSNVAVFEVALDEIVSIVLGNVPSFVAVPSLLKDPGIVSLAKIVFPPDEISLLVKVLKVAGTLFDPLAETLPALPELLLLVNVIKVLALVEAGLVRIVLMTTLALVDSALVETLLILDDMLPLVTPSLTISEIEFIGTLLLVAEDRLVEILLMLAEIFALFTVVLTLAELLPLAEFGFAGLLLTLVEMVTLVIAILMLVELLLLAEVGLAEMLLALAELEPLLTAVLTLAEILPAADVALVKVLLVLAELLPLVMIVLLVEEASSSIEAVVRLLPVVEPALTVNSPLSPSERTLVMLVPLDGLIVSPVTETLVV